MIRGLPASSDQLLEEEAQAAEDPLEETPPPPARRHRPLRFSPASILPFPPSPAPPDADEDVQLAGESPARLCAWR